MCQYNTNQQEIRTHHQEMETDTFSEACLEDTININDLVMSSDTEKMVRLYYDDYDDDTITTANNQKMIRYLKNKNNDDKSKK